MRNNYKTGVWAEYAAALFLTCKGYRVLGMRVRTPVGEIDILAMKNNTLIAVEVKASRDGHATLERIDHHKRMRVARSLSYLQTKRRYARFHDIRCDALSLSSWQFRHIINAW
jgi:putative endonuclease